MLRLDTSQNVEKMWVKICNLNHIPKIGGSESRSCGRRDLFWNFPFDVCLCERRFFHLLSGHYSVPRTFLLPREGNTPCLIHSAVCLFLANSCPLRIHQIKSPQLFFFSAISDVPQFQLHVDFFSGPGNLWYYSASKTWFYDAKWIRNMVRRWHYVEMLSLNLLDFLSCLSFSAFVWPS